MPVEIATGARVRLSFDGVKVGYATGVNVRQHIAFEPIKVLDDIQAVQHEPVDYDVSMSARRVRIIGDTIKARGWFPKQGQSTSEFLLNILNQGEMTATIEDRKTGEVLAQVEGVRISESSLNVDARGLAGEDVTMVARLVRDESE